MKLLNTWPIIVSLAVPHTSSSRCVAKEADPEASVVRALAASCPCLGQVIFYQDNLESWYEILKASCPLFGEVNLDSDDD